VLISYPTFQLLIIFSGLYDHLNSFRHIFSLPGVLKKFLIASFPYPHKYFSSDSSPFPLVRNIKSNTPSSGALCKGFLKHPAADIFTLKGQMQFFPQRWITIDILKQHIPENRSYTLCYVSMYTLFLITSGLWIFSDNEVSEDGCLLGRNAE
jgi:hypothetical protein